MNGPAHYAEAERLLRGNYVPIGVRGADEPTSYDGKPSQQAVAQANAHATLAAAAATIELALSMQDSNGVSVDWLKTVGP